MGQHNSFFSCLRNDLPGITIHRCICHSTHLCAGEACKQLPHQSKALTRNIYWIFKTVENVRLNSVNVKISQPISLQNTEALQETMVALTEGQCLFSLTSGLMPDCMLERFFLQTQQSLRLHYLFLEWALPKFTDPNQYFHSESMVITSLRSRMCETYNDLLLTIMQQDYVLHTALTQINFHDYESFYHTPQCTWV